MASEEYRAVGIIGIVLYIVILCIAVYLFRQEMGERAFLMKQIFLSMLMVMSIMELPRYFNLAVDNSYDSQSAYCCHIIAGVFFFAAFSILCKQWCEILRAGDKAGENIIIVIFYGTYGLIISNLAFIVDDVVTIALCLNSASLDDFFHSTDFYVFTLLEGIRNIVYSIFLLYYGITLTYRLGNMDFSVRGVGRLWDYLKSLREDTMDNIITLKIVRISLVLSLCAACFTLRVSMLIVKLATLDYSTNVSFSTFGLIWFTLADFIPRVVPCLALMFMVRTASANSGNADSEPAKELDSKEDSQETDGEKEREALDVENKQEVKSGEANADASDDDSDLIVDEDEENRLSDFIRGLGKPAGNSRSASRGGSISAPVSKNASVSTSGSRGGSFSTFNPLSHPAHSKNNT